MKTTVTLEELLVSSLAQTDALAKLLHREGHHHAAGVSREDFRRAGEYQAMFKPDTTLTQHEPNSKFFVDAINRVK